MPKNKGKGGKNRRRGKNENEFEKRELIFKEDQQEYAQVTKMLGNGRLEAMCFDGVKRLCHIRGKLRKKVSEWSSALFVYISPLSLSARSLSAALLARLSWGVCSFGIDCQRMRRRIYIYLFVLRQNASTYSARLGMCECVLGVFCKRLTNSHIIASTFSASSFDLPSLRWLSIGPLCVGVIVLVLQ